MCRKNAALAGVLIALGAGFFCLWYWRAGFSACSWAQAWWRWGSCARKNGGISLSVCAYR